MMFAFNIKTKELAVSNVCPDREQTLSVFTSVIFSGEEGGTVQLNRSLKKQISKPGLWIFVMVFFQLL